MKTIFDKKSIGRRFKELRSDKTQDKFAELLGFGQTYLSHVELGKVKPSLELLFSVSKICNVTIDYLVTGKDEPAHIEEKIERRVEGFVLLIQSHEQHVKTQGKLIKKLEAVNAALEQRLDDLLDNNHSKKARRANTT